MKWKKSEYKISGLWGAINLAAIASGYVCEITEGLAVGITNKLPAPQKDGSFKWRPAGFWTMSILPEGLAFKTFKTKKAAQEFIEKDAENLKKYIADCRRRRNNGSVDAAHDEWQGI